MPVPAGYKLNKPESAAATPKLPPGYTLDSAPGEVAAVASSVPSAPSSLPAPTGSIRPLTTRDRFLYPDLYPVGVKGEGIGENLKNLAQRGGVGIFQLANAAMTPRDTVAGILASLLPEPAVHTINRVVDWGRSLPIPGSQYMWTQLPEKTENPLHAAYQAVATSRGPMELAGKAAPLAGQAIAGDALGVALPKIGSDLLHAAPESIARSITGTGAGPVEQLVKDTRAANEKIDAVNADRVEAHTKAETAAEQANAAATRGYNQKVGQTIQQRRAAAAADQTRRTAAAQTQVYGSQLIYGLNQLDRALRERAGVMFDAVRDKVGGATQPGTDLGTAARAALTKISGSSELPKPFRDILGKYPESEPATIEYQGAQIPRGHPLYDVLAKNGATGAPPVSFSDLQGYYTETGAELAKGTLPGDVYQATRELHSAIGDMMQQMADSAGAGKQFWDSRVFYRDYMDAFHEPAGPSGSGSPVAQVLLAKDPAVAVAKFSGTAGDRGVAILRRYNSNLADLAQRAGAIKRETAAVTASAPRTVKSIVDLPPAKTTAAPALELRPRQTISSPDIAAARRAAAEARASRVWSRGQWAATWPIFQAARALWGGHIPSIPMMGLESAGMLATVKATTQLMRYPPMIRFLTQARPEDVALIPPEMRGDLPGLVHLAQREGITVAPALVAAAAGTGGTGSIPSAQNQTAFSPAQAIQAMQSNQQTSSAPQPPSQGAQ